jgi:hypothetical protein
MIDLEEIELKVAAEMERQTDPQEVKIRLLADLIEAGTVEAGYHRACKHPDTARSQAECNVRRYELQKRQEEADKPSAVCGRYGVYAHRSDRVNPEDGNFIRGITAVRKEPKVNRREAKRARQMARQLTVQA